MPREIFGELSNPSVTLGSRARYTVAVSMAAHALACCVLVIVPLVAADVLPSPPQVLAFVARLDAPPPPPPAPAAARASSAQSRSNPATAPAAAPDTIRPGAPDTTDVPGAVPGGLPADLPGVPLGTGLGSLPVVPVEPPPPAPQRPVRPGGHIKAPEKVRHVPPVYPAMAQQARIEGTVVLEATIGTDGRVTGVRVVRSKPLLDQAAMDAVMQWRFTPTLLNGVPVPVLLTVHVTFTLSR
ncbi:MAG TPA: energy transducer TonB [Vicinamibacterales bacterium]|nr:energy transducer TonB [Vicinamibacterales bacterium]